ncbi:MAG: thiamine-phosphate kinase [Planctomycetes bacterium]|nr:thiamine-phosphate kinase [Planctomycetota bacterium]
MESEFLGWLRTRLPASPWLRLGPGDDAAVLRLGEAREAPADVAPADVIVTTDLLTHGVDFRVGSDDPRRIGRKALAVNLSDLAAMAAIPRAALFSVALPRHGALELAQALYEGILPLAEQFQVAIAGGDTNTWDGGLVICVTAMGVTGPGGVLKRSGALPGDDILVTGPLGGSILGHQFDFQPRVQEALQLMQRYELHAGLDCSDGLARDIARLCEASGCGAEIDLARVPIADDAKMLSRQQANGVTPLEHALHDGEDFELILAVAPEEATRMLADRSLTTPLARIGRFVAEPGLWQVAASGQRKPLSPKGWEH